MKRLAFLLLALSLVNMAFSQDHVHPGEPKMTQPNTALDTLEKFNDPRNFLATRPTFDIAAFNKNKAWNKEYRFVREDGVHVFQLEFPNHGYKEELTRPGSHYNYAYGYYTSGELQGMTTGFCNYIIGEGLFFDKAGNIIERRNFDGNFLPIEKLREHFIELTQRDKNDKSTGIDIYDMANVMDVSHVKNEDDEGRVYYIILVSKTPYSRELTGYLLDGSTGEILYKTDTFRTPAGYLPSAYNEYKKYLKGGRK